MYSFSKDNKCQVSHEEFVV